MHKINYEKDSILIIANGESILKYKIGREINKFKNIARINNYKINNFEKYSGSSTTIWFNGANQGLVKNKNLPENIIVSIPSTVQQKKKYIEKHITSRIKTKDFNMIPISTIIKYEKKVGHNRLTTGMYAILWALENFKNIYIHGFDFFLDSKGHYFDYQVTKSLKRLNLLKTATKHNLILEKNYVSKLIAENKVIKLISTIN